MPGFEFNRFADLTEREAKHLCCGICLNIFNNAVNGDCGHTFCKECIQNWIEDNHKECPECRKEFRRKRSNQMDSEESLIIISNVIFIRNLKINSLINELKTKCDFHSNGCQEIVEFGLLSAHLKECEHRICKTCGFIIGSASDHNCAELLKKDRNEWQLKYNKLNDILSNVLIELKSIEVFPNFVIFGTIYSRLFQIELGSDGFKFFFGPQKSFDIQFETIEELMYCSKPSLPLIIIKPNAQTFKLIRESLENRDSVNDPTQTYVIIDLFLQSIDAKVWMSLPLFAFQSRPDLKCEPLDESKAIEIMHHAQRL